MNMLLKLQSSSRDQIFEFSILKFRDFENLS